ncbi:MAG: hypothetical protein PHT37_01700 [Candidatus Cloacimonetes bacterium]|jgi:hypothetical protein|nr:hypothetical protein [Candidatus Cloacimonadota bacterium]MDD4276589.1 hypothetical protein [Candidatus Cloacimonadota bacterium]MDY0325024.1 hypothetical protein [Candidatus Cloacimonadaceae bacterium]
MELILNDFGKKGSQLRCLLFAGLGKEKIQEQLLKIINQKNKDKIDVCFPENEDFIYYPQGLQNQTEIQLDKVKIPIKGSTAYCDVINQWWLAISRKTPTWDFVCTANIDGRQGLILIEAKAHKGELVKELDPSHAKDGSLNRSKIEQALDSINIQYGYKLSADDYYQLSNRIAWSMKLASEGIPVILIYLGCLNTVDMSITKNDYLFDTTNKWVDLVRDYSQNIDFSDWEKTISAEKMKDNEDSTKAENFYPIIRSLDIQLVDGVVIIKD